MEVTTQKSEESVIQEVRMRFRICNYLFTTAFLWIVAGYGLGILNSGTNWNTISTVLVATGYGIFSVAFAMTLAIYRCPICDKYLSRFRPDKTKCSRCGARVRLTETGRP